MSHAGVVTKFVPPAATMPARRGLMFVLSSPSGAGKTTMSRRLMDGDSEIVMSVSVTTRLGSSSPRQRIRMVNPRPV